MKHRVASSALLVAALTTAVSGGDPPLTPCGSMNPNAPLGCIRSILSPGCVEPVPPVGTPWGWQGREDTHCGFRLRFRFRAYCPCGPPLANIPCLTAP